MTTGREDHMGVWLAAPLEREWVGAQGKEKESARENGTAFGAIATSLPVK